ncbi:MAG: hybrid sensor histidine kinase/response regulator [Thermoanaerobaculia bacterium]
MTRKRLGPDEAAKLRLEAEQRLKERGGSRHAPLPADEVERVRHDLRVHQIELEMQNDELRTAQEHLVAERGRYFDLFELAPVGYLTLNTEGKILEANLTAASLFGVSRADIVGRQLTSFIASADQDVYYLHRRGLETGAPPDSCEVRLVEAGETERWVALSTVAAREPEGSAVWRTMISDITGRKRAEEELAQSQSRLLEAQTLEAVARLAGGVAHNFNNILQALTSLSALLRLSASAAETSRIVGEVDAQVARGAGLAKQLLSLSPDHPVAGVPIDLRALLEAATPPLRAMLPDSVRLSLETGDASKPLWMEGDAGQIEQIVMNLVFNAIEAMPAGGTLSIRAHSGAGVVELEVEDTGRVIDGMTRKHLFEPFLTTKEAKSASVRGLAIAYRFVQSHGGRIDVESGVGNGTLLRVVFPAADAPSALSAEAETGTELVPGEGEQILVVEDEDATRDGLSTLLGMLGYSVRTSQSGEAALALPAMPAPDLLLTDVLLPGITGPVLAEQLRQRWPRLKVILMSGYTSDIALPRGVTGKPVRFLQKPFEMARLSREVRAALEDGDDR